MFNLGLIIATFLLFTHTFKVSSSELNLGEVENKASLLRDASLSQSSVLFKKNSNSEPSHCDVCFFSKSAISDTRFEAHSVKKTFRGLNSSLIQNRAILARAPPHS